MSYLPKRARTMSALPLIMLDAAAVVVSFWFAMLFRFDGQISLEYVQSLLLELPAIVAIFILSNLAFGLYRCIWRYTSAIEALTIGAASLASTTLILCIDLLGKGDR